MEKIMRLTKTAALLVGFGALAIVHAACAEERIDTVDTAYAMAGTPGLHKPATANTIENFTKARHENDGKHPVNILVFDTQLSKLAELELISSLDGAVRN